MKKVIAVLILFLALFSGCRIIQGIRFRMYEKEQEELDSLTDKCYSKSEMKEIEKIEKKYKKKSDILLHIEIADVSKRNRNTLEGDLDYPEKPYIWMVLWTQDSDKGKQLWYMDYSSNYLTEYELHYLAEDIDKYKQTIVSFVRYEDVM